MDFTNEPNTGAGFLDAPELPPSPWQRVAHDLQDAGYTTNRDTGLAVHYMPRAARVNYTPGPDDDGDEWRAAALTAAAIVLGDLARWNVRESRDDTNALYALTVTERTDPCNL